MERLLTYVPWCYPCRRPDYQFGRHFFLLLTCVCFCTIANEYIPEACGNVSHDSSTTTHRVAKLRDEHVVHDIVSPSGGVTLPERRTCGNCKPEDTLSASSPPGGGATPSSWRVAPTYKSCPATCSMFRCSSNSGLRAARKCGPSRLVVQWSVQKSWRLLHQAHHRRKWLLV